MATTSSPSKSPKSKSRSSRKTKHRQSLQKPNGVISPRVKKVGAEHFAILCIDPAKMRSETMMADYLGNILMQPSTVEHLAATLQNHIQLVKDTLVKNAIYDSIVTIERTGNYHLPIQKVFVQAGFEVRLVHPFATKQYRLPADAGNKTDATDLFAQHRAAVAGFGLCESPLPPLYERLQLRVRHRRDLVEKSSAIACQIREHLHLCMPRYTNLFSNFFSHQPAITIARVLGSPQAIVDIQIDGLRKLLSENALRFQTATIEKIFAWAQQTAKLVPVPLPETHRMICNDLFELYLSIEKRISRLEAEIAGDLAQTPFIRLLAIPAINVVSAADLAGEMGPIKHYANANAITGRSGLYPSRYQSDQTDHPGSIVRTANRRLRAALMRIADNLANLNCHFRLTAASEEILKIAKQATRVKIAKRFTRIAFACLAGDAPLKHPCCRDYNSIIEKLRSFHEQHGTPLDQTLKDLENVVTQLPMKTKSLEAEIVSQSLTQRLTARRGPKHVGELLTSILAQLNATSQTLPPKPSEEQTASN